MELQRKFKLPRMIANSIAKTAFKIKTFWKKESLEHQEKFLINLIHKCRNTVFWKRYWFADIQTIEQFQREVPIFTYKEFQPRVEYMLKWEKDIAYPWKIPLFAVSSGTTWEKWKYLPLTKEHINSSQFNWWTKLISYYCKANPKTKICTWKTIAIWWTFVENPYTKEHNVWYITAILQKRTPWYARLFKSPSPDIAFIEDREEKSKRIVEETLHQNITWITGQPSRCTQFLYKVLEKTWKSNIHEIWPDFEVFFWWWMAVDLYKDTLKELFPDPKFKYRQSYNASEWFFACQCENDADDMLLLTDNGVFYEFIPHEEFGKENPKVISLKDVELDKEYVIVITTNAWIRRYIIGDTVKFTEIEPYYKIKITWRTKYYIDVVGEWTTVEYTDKAIIEACKKVWAIATDYTAWPVTPKWTQRWAYERIIEFWKEPKDIKEFQKVLDEELQKAFSNYYDERNYNNTLDELIVHKAPAWTFQKWLEHNNRAMGCSKVPKLMNDRHVLEEIFEIMWD